jgi:serine/threonine protein kinase
LRTIRIMAQVCSALAAAHDAGIVHRDLKPENIMVLRDPADPAQERVKVLDFGIAKMMAPEECTQDALPVSSDAEPSSSVPSGDLTKMGTVIGTPDYMAPEQFMAKPVDARTDVYACGVLLHQLITGKLPLGDEHPMMTMQLRITQNGPRPSALVPDVLPKLDDLVASALSLEPADRPVSARKMQERLLEMLPEAANTLLPLATETLIRYPQVRVGSASVQADGPTLPSMSGTRPSDTRPSPVAIVVGASGLPRMFTPLPNVSMVNLHQRGALGLSSTAEPPSAPVEVDDHHAAPPAADPAEPTRATPVKSSRTERGPALWVAFVVVLATVALVVMFTRW